MIDSPEFTSEMIRRYRMLYTPERIEQELAEAGVDTLEALFERELQERAETLSSISQSVGPIDEWKTDSPVSGDAD